VRSDQSSKVRNRPGCNWEERRQAHPHPKVQGHPHCNGMTRAKGKLRMKKCHQRSKNRIGKGGLLPRISSLRSEIIIFQFHPILTSTSYCRVAPPFDPKDPRILHFEHPVKFLEAVDAGNMQHLGGVGLIRNTCSLVVILQPRADFLVPMLEVALQMAEVGGIIVVVSVLSILRQSRMKFTDAVTDNKQFSNTSISVSRNECCHSDYN